MSENYPPTPDPNANQGGANPYSGAGNGYTPGSNNVPNLADPNFFKALFDFSFSQFITVKFASFIYAAALILVGLGYVGVVISALSQNIWLALARSSSVRLWRCSMSSSSGSASNSPSP
jgi:hypothetical protein